MNLPLLISTLIIASIPGAFCSTLLDTPEALSVKKAAIVLLTECMEKTGATTADLEALREKRMPDTHNGLCMVECTFDRLRIMKGGKFDADGLMRVVTPFLKSNTAKLTGMRRLSQVCDKELGKGDRDKCKTARLLVDCVVKHGREFGLNIPQPNAT